MFQLCWFWQMSFKEWHNNGHICFQEYKFVSASFFIGVILWGVLFFIVGSVKEILDFVFCKFKFSCGNSVQIICQVFLIFIYDFVYFSWIRFFSCDDFYNFFVSLLKRLLLNDKLFEKSFLDFDWNKFELRLIPIFWLNLVLELCKVTRA